MTKPDNPPAFPTKEPLSSDELGMSLRDWFAGMAMQGQLAGQWNVEVNATTPQPLVNSIDAVAANAYALADVMLAERTKPNV